MAAPPPAGAAPVVPLPAGAAADPVLAAELPEPKMLDMIFPKMLI